MRIANSYSTFISSTESTVFLDLNSSLEVTQLYGFSFLKSWNKNNSSHKLKDNTQHVLSSIFLPEHIVPGTECNQYNISPRATRTQARSRTGQSVNQFRRLQLVQVGGTVPRCSHYLPASHQPIGCDHHSLVALQGCSGDSNCGDLGGAVSIHLALFPVGRVLVVVARSLQEDTWLLTLNIKSDQTLLRFLAQLAL